MAMTTLTVSQYVQGGHLWRRVDPVGEEECDDQNDSNEDACLNTCRVNICGDGFVRTGQRMRRRQRC